MLIAASEDSSVFMGSAIMRNINLYVNMVRFFSLDLLQIEGLYVPKAISVTKAV